MTDKSKLHRASQSGDLQMVAKLIAEGSDIESTWQGGFTPLSLAVDEGHLEVVEFLLAAGANVFVLDPESGNSLLHDAAHRGFTDILALLLRAGLNPNGTNNELKTPLHSACCGQLTATSCMVLLKECEDINAQDRDGYTPLLCAVEQMNVPAVLLLVQAGADQDLKSVFDETAVERAMNVLHSFESAKGKVPAKYRLEQRHLEEIIRLLAGSYPTLQSIKEGQAG